MENKNKLNFPDIDNVLQKVNEKIVYHYTSFDCLENILQSQKLWLSYVGGSNDYSEFIHGVELFKRILLSQQKNEKINNNIERICKAVRYAKKSNLCIGCFCKKGDLLSQWRAYGNDGMGLSVGFDTKILERLCTKEEFHFAQCVYDEKDKEDICRSALPKGYNVSEDPDEDEKTNLFLAMAVPSLFLKNTAFSEEQEVRIATPPESSLKKTKLRNRLLIYHEFDLGKDINSIIKEIYIGPAMKDLELRKAVEIILTDNGISDCKIKMSRIPYRNIRNY